MPFVCSICGEESTRICARCTKDACNNHLCEKCRRCSDCCECEITLSDDAQGPPVGSARAAIRAAAEMHLPLPEPGPDFLADPPSRPESAPLVVAEGNSAFALGEVPDGGPAVGRQDSPEGAAGSVPEGIAEAVAKGSPEDALAGPPQDGPESAAGGVPEGSPDTDPDPLPGALPPGPFDV